VSASRHVLAIDAGNTRVKGAVFDGDEIAHSFVVETSTLTEASYADTLTNQINRRIDGAILSSVVRGADEIFRSVVQKTVEADLHVTVPDSPIGVRVGVPDPGSVGIDRLLMAGEAYHRTNQATIVVGCGTAVTVDVVSEDGAYLGGTISAGTGTSAWSLSERTSLLPEVDLGSPIDAGVPDSTVSGIRTGVLLSTAGGIDRLVVELARRADIVNPSVLLTGGDSRLLSCILDTEHKLVDDLVLRGLARTCRRLSASG
jgi:type III pantothenate kinase